MGWPRALGLPGLLGAVPLLVRVRLAGAVDRLGNEAEAWAEPVEVPGCLWAPGSPADSDRPEGVVVSATAHMPRGCALDMRDALVSADGGATWLRAVGEPMPYPDRLWPGPWAESVPLRRWDG